MAVQFHKKAPLRLTLVEYRLIEQIINEIPEGELTDEEVNLRKKVRLIQHNIERAIQYQKEHKDERNQGESRDGQASGLGSDSEVGPAQHQ